MPGRRWAWCVRPVRLDAKDNIAVTIEGSRSSFIHHSFSSLWHHWAILVRGPIRAHPGMHRRSSRRACSRRRTAVAPDGRSLSEGGTAHELSREEAQEEDAEAQAPQNAEEDALATQAQGLTALPRRIATTQRTQHQSGAGFSHYLAQIGVKVPCDRARVASVCASSYERAARAERRSLSLHTVPP